ncbi:MFS transporter [Hanamia caeni]|uniref:MFS transporter n=1 Tax=Hanamia caeni TaxID=2294116 RepID=A0A3M9NJR1_9BACT|nr:MFS transporter [Hanamia caeni]RNI37994.1 MFS transporter [Hanamia caeni]
MKHINMSNRKAASIAAFGLVPLSGFATDLYLPSFPEMVRVFHATPAQIQLTLSVFLISYGVGQFFAGSLMDSFGRYKPVIIALILFIVSNILIILTRNLFLLDACRILQGLCVSFIAVGKRTFFVDVYSGKQQQSYTALLTIVWGAAPIVAPFLGGFLQVHFGWTSSFYFLAVYAVILLIAELKYSGESLRYRTHFHFKPVTNIYLKLMKTRDFSVGVVILGLSFCLVISFNIAIPFIIDKVFHLSPVVTGYCALFSGIALFSGGIIGRYIGIAHLLKKAIIFSFIQAAIILLMFTFLDFLNTIFLLMIFVVFIHLIEGIIYNLFFTHCLIRFPKNAATAGGITSGGSYIVLSVALSGLLTLFPIPGQQTLAYSYLILCVSVIALLLIFRKSIVKGNELELNEKIK